MRLTKHLSIWQQYLCVLDSCEQRAKNFAELACSQELRSSVLDNIFSSLVYLNTEFSCIVYEVLFFCIIGFPAVTLVDVFFKHVNGYELEFFSYNGYCSYIFRFNIEHGILNQFEKKGFLEGRISASFS